MAKARLGVAHRASGNFGSLAIRLKVHLASPSFPEHHTSFFRPTYAWRRAPQALMGSFSSLQSQAMRLASFGIGPLQKAAMFAVKTKEKMMRVISQTELSRLTRAQLFSLYTQMQAVLSGLPQGTLEYEFTLSTLNNIKAVLLRKSLSP